MKTIGQGVMGARGLRTAGWVLALVFLSGCMGNSQTTKPRVDDNALYEGRATVTFSSLPVAETAKEAIEEGDKQIGLTEYDKALYMYIQAMELDESNTEAMYKIGSIHLQRGGIYKSVLAFNSVLNLDAEHVGANEARGVIFLKGNRYAEAQVHFMRAVDADKKRLSEVADNLEFDARSPALAYDGLGIIADLKGDHILAQHYYDTALQVNPRSAITHNNLGYSFYLTKSWRDAERAYKKALKIEPQYAQGWRNLGLLYARQANYMSAITAFERVMDLAHAYNDVGYICLLEGKYKKAEYFFEKAMTLSPTYYEKANDNLRLTRRMRDTLASLQ